MAVRGRNSVKQALRVVPNCEGSVALRLRLMFLDFTTFASAFLLSVWGLSSDEAWTAVHRSSKIIIALS